MAEGKFKMGWYLFALGGGVLAGGLFSRAQYHKGQADAYKKISEDLEKLSDEAEKMLEKEKESH